MWTEVIIAAATAAVAWTAIQSLRRERKRDRERRQAADARVSAIAYALRRQLQSWWPEGTWPSPDTDQKVMRKAESLVPHFDVAEERIEDLLALAPNASPEVSKSIREAAVRFYRGTRFINEAADAEGQKIEKDEEGYPTNVKFPREVTERFSRSFPLLLETVEYLEEVIDEELLEAAEELPE